MGPWPLDLLSRARTALLVTGPATWPSIRETATACRQEVEAIDLVI